MHDSNSLAVFCPISYFFQKCAYHILWFNSGIQNPVAQILMRNLGAFPTQILVLYYNRESTVLEVSDLLNFDNQ